MINLLPDTYKQEIRAARVNVILLRYIIIMLCAVVVLAGLMTGAFVVLNTSRTSAETKVAENQQRVSDYASIKTRADSFRADLSTAKTILDSNVSFTKLIYRIAGIVPPNVVLDGLTLDPKVLGSETTVNAEAKTFADATKLKNALNQNSDIFSGVQLQSVTIGDNATPYPVKIVLSVTINKGALK